MLNYTIIFLLLSITAAIFGFTGIAATAAWIAKILFYIFLIAFLFSIIAPRMRLK